MQFTLAQSPFLDNLKDPAQGKHLETIEYYMDRIFA